ncbi:hypothetical protein Droror1_Dr00012398 [Drosera rotundifolia]
MEKQKPSTKKKSKQGRKSSGFRSPWEMLQEDGKQLKGECFAVLHQTHCPSRARLESSHKTACRSYRKLLSGGPIFEAFRKAVRRVTTACLSYPKGCIDKIELAKKKFGYAE